MLRRSNGGWGHPEIGYIQGLKIVDRLSLRSSEAEFEYRRPSSTVLVACTWMAVSNLDQYGINR